MKNFVRSVVASIALSASALIAYPITIKNATALEAKVTIELVLCSDITVTLLPGETKTTETIGCCWKKMRVAVKRPSGAFLDLASFTPQDQDQDTGFGMACRGYDFTITGEIAVTGDTTTGSFKIGRLNVTFTYKS
jgi:hypothetical protein